MKDNGFTEKLVAINRITKVVKGGRRFGFAALVVVGDQKCSIGVGKGKSKRKTGLGRAERKKWTSSRISATLWDIVKMAKIDFLPLFVQFFIL